MSAPSSGRPDVGTGCALLEAHGVGNHQSCLVTQLLCQGLQVRTACLGPQRQSLFGQ